jgi:hypothetical protein
MVEGEYSPDLPLFYRVPKTFGSHRVITRLSLSDSIVYQSIFSKHWMGRVIDKKLGAKIFGNRVNLYSKGKKEQRPFLKNYKKQRNDFISFQQKSIDAGYRWRLEVDVTNFYPSIPHKKLFGVLRTHFAKYPELIDLLECQLSSWFPNGRGIPQGHEASAVLANAFLHPLDKCFEALSCRYGRYGDDMVFLFKTPEEASYCADKISRLLLDYGLRTNSKTSLKYYETSSPLDVMHIANDYLYLDGDKFDLSEVQQLVETSTSLDDYFEKIRKFEGLEKHEMSRLKYYLRTGGIFSDEHHTLVIQAFFDSSELSFFTSAYLSRYIKDDPDLFLQFLQAFKQHIRKLTPWQKYNATSLLLTSEQAGKRNRLGSLSILIKSQGVWELDFLSFLTDLSSTKSIEQACVEHAKDLSNAQYLYYLTVAVFNASYCADLLTKESYLEGGTFTKILASIFNVEAAASSQEAVPVQTSQTASPAVLELSEEKEAKLFDLLEEIRDLYYVPKPLFSIVNESDDFFQVSCHGKVSDFVFEKKNKWSHVCYMLVSRHQNGYSPIVKNTQLVEYLLHEHQRRDFTHAPTNESNDKIRSTVNGLVKIANQHFYKCAPELLIGKQIISQKVNPGHVTLLLSELVE